MISLPLLKKKPGLLSGIWGTAHHFLSMNRIERVQRHIANICKHKMELEQIGKSDSVLD